MTIYLAAQAAPTTGSDSSAAGTEDSSIAEADDPGGISTPAGGDEPKLIDPTSVVCERASGAVKFTVVVNRSASKYDGVDEVDEGVIAALAVAYGSEVGAFAEELEEETDGGGADMVEEEHRSMVVWSAALDDDEQAGCGTMCVATLGQEPCRGQVSGLSTGKSTTKCTGSVMRAFWPNRDESHSITWDKREQESQEKCCTLTWLAPSSRQEPLTKCSTCRSTWTIFRNFADWGCLLGKTKLETI